MQFKKKYPHPFCARCNPIPLLGLAIESTGNDASEDEPISIGIVNAQGFPLFYSVISPDLCKAWVPSQSRDRVKREITQGMPLSGDLVRVVRTITVDASVVIYGADFAKALIGNYLDQAYEVHCAQKAYWDVTGGSDQYPRALKLEEVSDRIGHAHRNDLYNALSDAHAALAVWEWCECNIDFNQ